MLAKPKNAFKKNYEIYIFARFGGSITHVFRKRSSKHKQSEHKMFHCITIKTERAIRH